MIHKKPWVNRAIIAAMLLTIGGSHIAQGAVLTSIRPLEFIAQAITSGVTHTEVLLPDGASPHDYALKPSDLKKVREAELVVWVGSELEAFLTKPIEQYASHKELALIDLPQIKSQLIAGDDDDDDDDEGSEQVEGESNHAHDNDASAVHHHGQYNPHIWLSPTIAKQIAIAIHDKLLRQEPQKQQTLDANLRKFEQQLKQTQEKIAILLKPVQGKGYFVFHDAYRYFEEAFDLTPLGYFTVNPEIQPGAQRLQQIRTELVEHKAVCIFAEPQFRPAVINTIAQGTNVRHGVLDPLGSKIKLANDSYMVFLTELAQSYVSCLRGE